MIYIAFNHAGQAHNLGDCGDYDAAVEIANDTLGIHWQFILKLNELKCIVKAADEKNQYENRT
jgi:hypothetical protein